VPRTNLAGASGRVSGTFQYQLAIGTNVAGTYTYTLRVIDSKGNASNVVESSFEAK
jgi:hypothetical protein